MRSVLLSMTIVSCAWLAGCSAASSTPGDAGSAASAGTLVSNGGSAGAGTAGGGAAGMAQAGTGGASQAGGGGGAINGGAGGGGGTTGGAGSVGSGGVTSFVHPGILVNKGMLDFVKAQVAAGAKTAKDALSAAENDDHGKLDYTASPVENVACGPTSSGPGAADCQNEKDDAAAAYTHALIWYYTGDQKHADVAKAIMDAWSSTVKEHTLDNAQLQSAWVAEVFPRAAEIIRYTNAGWTDDKVAQFSAMLNTAYLPYVKDGSTRIGNWDTSAIEAAMNIAVFNDDTVEFNKTLDLWRARTPAYIYLSSDGPLPVQPPRVGMMSDSDLKGYWFNPKSFVDGLMQESCRDLPGSGTQGFGHAQYGVAAIINAAETARVQGVDLFSEQEKRLTAMLEFHAKYLNDPSSANSLCNTQIAGVSPDPMWEIGYNAYAGVLKQSLPQTQMLVQSIRPTGVTHHMVFETLSHGDIGSAGL